jgi:hypothetical protein
MVVKNISYDQVVLYYLACQKLARRFVPSCLRGGLLALFGGTERYDTILDEH